MNLPTTASSLQGDCFCGLVSINDPQKVTSGFVERLTDAMRYAAKWLKSSLLCPSVFHMAASLRRYPPYTFTPAFLKSRIMELIAKAPDEPDTPKISPPGQTTLLCLRPRRIS